MKLVEWVVFKPNEKQQLEKMLTDGGTKPENITKMMNVFSLPYSEMSKIAKLWSSKMEKKS